MEISHSKQALAKKQLLLKEYPGLKLHFSELQNKIEMNPNDGTKELMVNHGGRSTPVRIMSAETEIFGGAASYSKELAAVYICSDDLAMGRIVQYLF